MPFPLPLVPFERYMLCDDRPAYPMTFLVRLELKGHLDQHSLQAAIEHTFARHPLLIAKVRYTRLGRLFWHSSHGVPKIQQLPWGQLPFENGDARLELDQEPGTRVWCYHTGERSELWFQFHHACCDARGAIQFIEDLFHQYVLRTEKHRAIGSPRSIRVQRLAARGTFEKMRLIEKLCRIPMGLHRLWSNVRKRPTPICATQADAAGFPNDGHSRFPAFASRSFAEEQVSALKQTSRSLGATINDVLQACLFRVLRDWNQSRGEDTRRSVLRLAIPMDMRCAADSESPCANIVSMVFVDRTGEQIERGFELLQGIAKEMRHLKENRLGSTMLKALRVLTLIPFGLKAVLSAKRCQATAVLSNLGKVFDASSLSMGDQHLRFNGAVLDGVSFLVPLRPGTALAFSVCTYAGQLQISMHYDLRLIHRESAEELIDAFVAALENASQLEHRSSTFASTQTTFRVKVPHCHFAADQVRHSV